MPVLRRLDPYVPLILLLSVFAAAPLTAPGFFLNAHDATIGAYFLWQFDASLADGAWWPVWAADMVYGYGHPLFLIIAPLPYYLAEVFLVLGRALAGGNPITAAIKVVYAIAMLGSGLTMYAYARRWLGREGGLVAAVAYVYIPFHLVDIYVRADLAEYVALAIFPAALWALDRTFDAPDRSGRMRGAAATAVVYAAIVLTHFTMAVIFAPVMAAYALWRAGASAGRGPAPAWPRRVAAGLAAPAAGMLAGVALAGAFVVPVLAELRYLDAGGLAGGYFSYSRHFVYLSQFFSPFWGYGYAGEGPGDQMAYQLGAVPILLAIVALIGLLSVRGKRSGASDPERHAASTTAFFLLLTGLFLFLMLAVSQPLWDLLRPVVSFIQFPWRLLVVTCLTMAFLSGAIVRGAPRLAPVLVVLLVMASYTYTVPQHTGGDVSLKGMIEFQVRTKELLGDTMWVKEHPTTSPLVPQYLAQQPLQRAVAIDGQAEVITTRIGGSSVEARVTSSGDTGVGFYTRYFPGWRAAVDGQEAPLEPWGDQGLIRVNVPAGQHTVALRYGDTSARTAGKVLSLLTLVGIVGVLVAARGSRV